MDIYLKKSFFCSKMKLLKILINESRYREASQKYRPYIDAEVEASFESDGSNLNMLTLLLNNDFMYNTKQKYLNFLLKSWYSPKSEWDKISSLNVPGNEKNLATAIKKTNREGKKKNDFVEQAILILEFFDKNKSKFTYTDINKYDVIWDLYPEYVELKEVAEKKQAEKDFEKLYEDERVLIGIPKTYEASCVYGARTKWCTSGKDDFYWRKHIKEGLLYFIIFKKVDPDSHFAKVAIHFKFDNPSPIFEQDWWDAVDDKMSSKSKEALRLAIPEKGLQAIILNQTKSLKPDFINIMYEKIKTEMVNKPVINLGVATENKMVYFGWDLEDVRKFETQKINTIDVVINYQYNVKERFISNDSDENKKPIYSERGRCFIVFKIDKESQHSNTFDTVFDFEADPDERNVIPTIQFKSPQSEFSFQFYINDHLRVIFNKNIDVILERGLKK